MSRQEAIEHEYNQSRFTLAVMIVILIAVALFGSFADFGTGAASFEMLLLGALLVLLGVAAVAPALRVRFGWRVGQ